MLLNFVNIGEQLLKDIDQTIVYREASLYIMPPLRLAADALMTALQAHSQQSTRKASHRYFETRKSLKVISETMDACKNESGLYDDCMGECRAYLESSEETPPSLRTGFGTSFSLGNN